MREVYAHQSSCGVVTVADISAFMVDKVDVDNKLLHRHHGYLCLFCRSAGAECPKLPHRRFVDTLLCEIDIE